MQAYYHRHRDDEDFFETLPTGFTPLEVACGQGLLLSAERILQDGADPQAADLQGWTPLIAAVSYGQLEVIQLLLSHTEEIVEPEISVANFYRTKDPSDLKDDFVGLDQPDNNGWTPLFWAVIKNQYKAAEALLTAGASVSVRDGAKWTPFEWAAFIADRAFVDLILRFTSGAQLKGARYKKPPNHHPEELSPLFLAAAAGDYRSIEAMLQSGCEKPISTEQNLEKLFKALVKLDPSWIEETEYHDVGTRYSILTSSLLPINSFPGKLLELAIPLDQRTIVKMLVELRVTLGSLNESQTEHSAPDRCLLQPLPDL
jgi:ankyrin repeat protein